MAGRRPARLGCSGVDVDVSRRVVWCAGMQDCEWSRRRRSQERARLARRWLRSSSGIAACLSAAKGGAGTQRGSFAAPHGCWWTGVWARGDRAVERPPEDRVGVQAAVFSLGRARRMSPGWGGRALRDESLARGVPGGRPGGRRGLAASAGRKASCARRAIFRLHECDGRYIRCSRQKGRGGARGEGCVAFPRSCWERSGVRFAGVCWASTLDFGGSVRGCDGLGAGRGCAEEWRFSACPWKGAFDGFLALWLVANGGSLPVLCCMGEGRRGLGRRRRNDLFGVVEGRARLFAYPGDNPLGEFRSSRQSDWQWRDTCSVAAGGRFVALVLFSQHAYSCLPRPLFRLSASSFQRRLLPSLFLFSSAPCRFLFLFSLLTPLSFSLFLSVSFAIGQVPPSS